MSDWLENEVAVVTGGSSGNGRSIAPTLAEYGADVVVVDLQAEPREGGTPTHERIRADHGRDATVVECDVSSVQEVLLAGLPVAGSPSLPSCSATSAFMSTPFAIATCALRWYVNT